jgi:hypothetical protein
MASTDPQRDTQPDVIEMAKVALSALVTSCSGVLIALLAYAGQAGTMSSDQKFYAAWVAVSAGSALWIAILSAFLGYLNTGLMVAWRPIPALWASAVITSFVSLILLGVALIQAGRLVIA